MEINIDVERKEEEHIKVDAYLTGNDLRIPNYKGHAVFYTEGPGQKNARIDFWSKNRDYFFDGSQPERRDAGIPVKIKSIKFEVEEI